MKTQLVQHGDLVIHSDYIERLRDEGLDSFDALMGAAGEQNLHKKNLARWRQRIVLRLGSQRLYLKRYRTPPIKEQLGLRLHGFQTAAAVEWYWLRQMKQMSIPVAVPVAFGYRRLGLLHQQSLLLTAEVPGRSLERWVVEERNGRLTDRRYRAQLYAALATFVRHLHGAGLIHRDLYLAHLFILDGCDASPKLFLIDLQRVLRPRFLRRRWLVKDLASLNYSTPSGAATSADRLRWFKQYRKIERLSRTDRALARAIAAKTARIARHDAKRMND